MLFYEKENVFMCLVAFQNIFQKIFSGVWKRSWKRRRKRQNPEKPGQTQKNTARSRRSTARSRVRVNRDWRERCFARDHAARSHVLSLSRSPFARPQFRKSFEVKIGTEMNFHGQRCFFTVNWKWFPENSIFKTNQTAYFTKNDFLKAFATKTNGP